jgi:hypothetical protein
LRLGTIEEDGAGLEDADVPVDSVVGEGERNIE